MRKSILFSLLCLVAITAVACGNGNSTNAGNSKGGNGGGNGGGTACAGDADGGETATVDPFETYRKEGRTWTYKMSSGMTMKNTVKNVTDKGCDLETQMYGADGKEMGPANSTPMKFETPAATDGATAEVKEPKKEKVKVEAGEFDSVSYDDGKTWMMEKHPGIIVKSEQMELVKFEE